MNENTKEALLKFVDAMEILTASVLLTIGTQTATEIMTACYALKVAVKKDETLQFPK